MSMRTDRAAHSAMPHRWQQQDRGLSVSTSHGRLVLIMHTTQSLQAVPEGICLLGGLLLLRVCTIIWIAPVCRLRGVRLLLLVGCSLRSACLPSARALLQISFHLKIGCSTPVTIDNQIMLDYIRRIRLAARHIMDGPVNVAEQR